MTGVRRWPLALIAAPAAVSIWSGWVGLGQLCGFGLVHPLPGIASGFELNTAITLPVGVEAYGAYALGAWLSATVAGPARTFAKRSAIGALALGMLGQVVYHLLAAAHAHRAPWPVVVLVSCLPVVTLGFGAALTHLLRAGTGPEISTDGGDFEAVHEAGISRATTDLAVPAVPEIRSAAADLNGHGHQAAELFAADVAAGTVPGIRAIRSGLHVGQDKARQVQEHLRTLTRTP